VTINPSPASSRDDRSAPGQAVTPAHDDQHDHDQHNPDDDGGHNDDRDHGQNLVDRHGHEDAAQRHHSHRHDHGHRHGHSHGHGGESGSAGERAERWGLAIGTIVCLVGGAAGAILETLFPTSALSQFPTAAYWPTWLILGLYLAAYVGGGWHTAWHALGDLVRGTVNIDLLMLIAAVGSAALGHWADGAALLFLFSLSHTLESYIMERTRRAITKLMDLAPEQALRLRAGASETVPISELMVGDRVLVHPGERIPCDGIIRVGTTSVDQSPMTGESMPVDKGPGEDVFAGTLNQQGVIELEVTRLARESTLSRMVTLVEQAQQERAGTQRFSEWFGARYAWFVIALATATFLVPWWLGEGSLVSQLQRAMTVLVVASPCAVVISIPAAILAAITSAARGGVLFKGGIALERTATLRAMAFDKTGTLTVGKPQVQAVLAAAGQSVESVLTQAASLEQHSEHPLAKAVVLAAQQRSLQFAAASDVQAVTGHGVTGLVDAKSLQLGKLVWLKAQALQLDPLLDQQIQEAQRSGATVIGLADQAQWLGALAITDTPRATVSVALQELRKLGLSKLVMLTGDARPVAAEMAGRWGLEFESDLLPHEKLERIHRIVESVGPTGMIGDGINDAPSLAAATVGFSLGGAGTDVAIETADVVLMTEDLRKLPYAVGLARYTQTIIWQNLTLAFGVMGCLLIATYLTRVPLPIAVLGHEGSTVLVILNGLRLLAFPRPAPWTGTTASGAEA
jgi:Zn2+/Cd2+-exporting ATPase